MCLQDLIDILADMFALVVYDFLQTYHKETYQLTKQILLRGGDKSHLVSKAM
jgi:hypothetical protein